MKMHKFEVYVLDSENLGADNIVSELDQNRYFSVVVKAQETTDIGEWSDDHELNMSSTSLERYRSYFKKTPKDLTVWYGKMPESCGRNNWTALLRGNNEIYTIACSEYPHRVRYYADCVRHIIGELPKRPHILEYDSDELTSCHICGGTGQKDGEPCWGLNFERTIHEAKPVPPVVEKYVICSMGRYRKGGLSVSQKPVEHTSVEEVMVELERLRKKCPEVSFGVFKLPLVAPFKPIAEN